MTIECGHCGYDLTSLVAEGRSVCPECGRVYVEPVPGANLARDLGCLPLAFVPAILGIGCLVASFGESWKEYLPIPWITLTPVYCYVVCYFAAARQKLPRPGFGAVPMGVGLLIANTLIVLVFMGTQR